jgi:hypothetical protein
MADVNISKFRAQVVRDGSKPATPGFVVSEGQSPTDPAGSGQNHLPVTIAAASTGLAITESQILGGAGTVGQYIRGDGSLADFPATTGGGSSVSYYLNGSVSQGTIGGVAYREVNRTPIFGAGTDISTSSNGYIANFITDAGDPNKLLIPAGNWNLETYFSASSGGGSPTFYVELYKYNGTTFTLIATSSGTPELIAFGTNINPYFTTLAVPETVLALTDRLALRYYVNTSGRTITLHTEDNHLCQVITTFTTGLTALNGLTTQVQFFAVGTSGTDFAISSVTDTHTFNLPTASATNRGALSSTDWTTFNNKENAITAGTTAQYFRGDKTFQTLNTSVVPEGTNLYYTEARVNANTNVAANTAARHNAVTIGTANGLSLSTQVLSLGLASAGVTGALSGTDWSTFNSKQNALTLTTTGTSGAATLVGSTLNIPQYQAAGTYVTAVTASSPLASSGGTTPNITIQQASGSQNGFLSSTDWTTFNNKQNALTNPVTGTGTSGQVAYFNGTTTITSESNLFWDATNDRLGIATSSPTEKLDVIGVIRGLMPSDPLTGTITGKILSFSSNPYGIHFRGYASGVHSIQTQREGNDAQLFGLSLQPLGGNVLIGTTTDAGYKLDVNGTGRITGVLTTNSGTNSTNGIQIISSLSSSLFTGGIEFIRTTVAGGSKVQPLRDAAIGGVGFSFLVTANNTAEVNATYTSALQILNTGAATFSNTLDTLGRVTITADAGNEQFNIRRASNTNAQLIAGVHSSGYAWMQSIEQNVAYRPLVLNRDGANVLIGTTTDNGEKLQVNGEITAVTRIRINKSTQSNQIFGDGNAFNISGSNNLGIRNDSGSIVFASGGANVQMLLNTSGNVGIGTTSPNARLHVSGDFRTVLTSGVGGDTLIAAINGVSNGYIINVDTSNNITHTWNTGLNVASLRISPSGNVGIANTNPLTKLHITQAVDSAYPTLGTGKGAVFIAGDTNLYGLYVGINTNDGNTYFQAMRNNSATAYNIVMQAAGGNVLIGTTTDNGNKLRVNGVGFFDQGVRTGQPVGTTTNNWLLGRALASGTSTPDRWIRVQIGLEYYDILAVYMGTL